MIRESEDRDFTFAFQPIVDVASRHVFSYEALIRGTRNEPANQLLERLPVERLYVLDQKARVGAISLAARLGIDCNLNLNVLPGSLYSSETSILSTLEAAELNHLPTDRIVLEITESEAIEDQLHFAALVNEYRGIGVKVAIDDFGAGYAGLNLLADFQPDLIKLDMKMVHGIERHGPRQAIVRAIGQACYDLGIDVVAEGVETVEEYAWLEHAGVSLFQGYLFAKPGFECLPAARFPEIA
jgi:EAL domain-containing protein (putative c-di-GMP-specific phosphodiesterase class I)